MGQALTKAFTACYAGHAGSDTKHVQEASSSVARDECVTISASLLTSSQGGECMTAGMSKEQIQAAIQTSKVQGWSELKQRSDDGAAPSGHAQENRVIWEQLKKQYRGLFMDLGEDMSLKLGRRIAEGGQAHIYEATIHPDCSNFDCVAKVFKMEGFSLADLQRQWPLAVKKLPLNESFLLPSILERNFVEDGVVFGEILTFCGLIYYGTFLEDGRFAFVMHKYWGDLRTLINLKMKESNYQGPPFSHLEATRIMHYIACGIKELHDRGVLHKDLKAANVLVTLQEESGKIHRAVVADFESAMLVQGTGFWKAPEVLEELQKRPCDRNVDIWTEKVDVYSFAITCYEILTGHIPFDGYGRSDWKRVINGERPPLPVYIDLRIRELVERCWHKEPAKRPTFEDIETELGHICIGA